MPNLKTEEVPVTNLDVTSYRPSVEAWNFHVDPHRIRFLIWGVKSGKSRAGAWEFVRYPLGLPGTLSWCVAPTYLHLQVDEREVVNILYSWPGIIKRRNRNEHTISLTNGSLIQFRSAEWPDALRGPNVDGVIWIDEGAYLREDAWWISRERVAATGADMFVTTTPHVRDWLWREVVDGGMPATQDYGEFHKGEKFVSHFPTWQFPWVAAKEMAAVKKSMSRLLFERDFAALFVSDASQVFRNLEEAMSMAILPADSKAPTVMGLDLGKFQDPSAAIIMDAGGRALWVDKWAETAWNIQRPRIIALSQKWNAAVIVDRSNIGSVIEEDLKNAGLTVNGVDLNDSRMKGELIQGLQMAFEQGRIKIPDPRSHQAPAAAQDLLDELGTYEHSLTRSGRVTYSAPQGLHDDLVMALALAYYGRGLGYAGGVNAATDVLVGRGELKKLVGPRPPRLERPKVYKGVFGRSRSRLGLQSDGPLWEH